MSTTFNLFRLRKFPPAPTKGAVLFRKEEVMLGNVRPAQTRVSFKGSSDDSGEIEWYTSHHEMLKRVEGRLYDGTEFHEFFKRNEILLTLWRNENLLVCKSGGVVAKNLVDELNELYPVSFRSDYLHIDFQAIRPQIREMNGIWISQINQPNMETLAFFGPGVDQSELYETLKSLGQAASILIRHEVSGAAIPVIVSAKGTVTFPQPAASEEQVARVLHLYQTLLKPGLVEKESRRTARDRRELERAAAQAAGKSRKKSERNNGNRWRKH